MRLGRIRDKIAASLPPQVVCFLVFEVRFEPIASETTQCNNSENREIALDFTDTSFQTERLIARSCRVEDATILVGLMTPDISSWVAVWPSPLSLEDAEKIISANIKAGKAGAAFPAVIVERTTGTVIGWLKIEITDGSQLLADLGYWIGESFQRRGYAFEVSKGAIDFAFSRLKVDAVRAGAQVANEASLKLLAKLGMTRKGHEDVWAPARQRHEKCEFWILKKA